MSIGVIVSSLSLILLPGISVYAQTYDNKYENSIKNQIENNTIMAIKSSLNASKFAIETGKFLLKGNIESALNAAANSIDAAEKSGNYANQSVIQLQLSNQNISSMMMASAASDSAAAAAAAGGSAAAAAAAGGSAAAAAGG